VAGSAQGRPPLPLIHPFQSGRWFTRGAHVEGRLATIRWCIHQNPLHENGRRFIVGAVMKHAAEVAALSLAVCGAIWLALNRQEADLHGRFEGRSGASDAKVTLASRRPPKLYSRSVNGIYAGVDTPGVIRCFDSRVQAVLPEGEYNESSSKQAASSVRIAGDAIRYATEFNRETVRLRLAELRRFCPDVALR
jgi:hypothetical protein